MVPFKQFPFRIQAGTIVTEDCVLTKFSIHYRFAISVHITFNLSS
jgi:hypothetical protein